MAHHAPVQDDPKQLENARHLWANFMQITKYSVIGIAALLLVMAMIFVQF